MAISTLNSQDQLLAKTVYMCSNILFTEQILFKLEVSLFLLTVRV